MQNILPGQKATRSTKVTVDHVSTYADLSGDYNPLHFDKKFAAKTKFKRLIAHGGLTTGLLHALVAMDLPGPGTVFLQTNWSFKAPVSPGDSIKGEVKVTKVRDDKPITELETRVSKGDGTVVLDGTALCYTMPITTPASDSDN